jgi:hypothetical protein
VLLPRALLLGSFVIPITWHIAKFYTPLGGCLDGNDAVLVGQVLAVRFVHGRRSTTVAHEQEDHKQEETSGNSAHDDEHGCRFDGLTAYVCKVDNQSIKINQSTHPFSPELPIFHRWTASILALEHCSRRH